MIFYRNTLSRWIPDRSASILIVAGGKNDRDIFRDLGFTNVVISNVDKTIPDDAIAPFTWSRQDAEALACAAGEFDYVVVHLGLHHCRSPHRGLLEMYRVARKAVVAFEPPDNMLVRIMRKIGLAQTYEYTAVCCRDGQCGGVNNTEIPNFVYRWTETEVEKTISSYAPMARHRFHYAHGSDEPTRAFIGQNTFKRFIIRLMTPGYRLFALCFPRQQNLFAFMIEKPVLVRDLHPWLNIEGGEVRFNTEWRKNS